MLEGFCRTCEYGEICRAGCHWTALSHGGTWLENRMCYHRVWHEPRARADRKGRWLPTCVAPAVLMAALGFSGCYASSDQHDRLDADARADVVEERDTVPDIAPELLPDPPVDPAVEPDEVVPDVVPDPPADVEPDEVPGYCPTTRDELCCFVCEGWTYYRGGYSSCEAVEASCMDDYAGPLPLPYDCPDPCCPTAEEACCMCLYDGPLPVPEQCPDPCEPPEDSLYSDTPPIPVDPDNE